MNVTDIEAWANIVRALVLPAIGYVAWVVRDVRDELRKINGRLGRMEQWREDHDKHDDTRFEQLERHMGWPRR